MEDKNERRRNLYRQSAAYRSEAKKRSREYYRRDKPLREGRIIKNILLTPLSKEVTVETIEDRAYTMEVYTMAESAKALGRTPLAFKKWVAEGMIPSPIIRCTAFGYRHYCLQELQAIAKILSEHGKEYEYFSHSHSQTIQKVYTEMSKVRMSLFGGVW